MTRLYKCKSQIILMRKKRRLIWEENGITMQRTLLYLHSIKRHVQKMERKTDNQKKTNNSKYRTVACIGKNSARRSTSIMS